MLEPNSTSPAIDLSSPSALEAPPAAWSNRARLLMRLGILLGLIIIAIGAIMFFTTYWILDQADIVNILLGLALIPIGLGLIYVAYQSQTNTPDHLYQALDAAAPRKWFIGAWVVGLLIYYGIVATKNYNLSNLNLLFAAIMGISALTAMAGGVWCLRWLSEKYRIEWPHGNQNAYAAIALHWPRQWTIGWAIVGGIASAVAAIILETLGLQIFASVFEQAAMQSLLTASQTSMFSNFTVVLVVLFIAAVVAPIVEEACKAAVLRLFRHRLKQPNDGVILGMAAGIGFGMLESLFYMFSVLLLGFWWIGAWARVATILMHGITTSLIGRAYVLSLQTNNRRTLWSGYGRAVLLHGLWNGLFFGAAILAINGQTLFGCGGLIVWLVVMSRQLPKIAVANVEASIQDEYTAANLPMPTDWSPMDDGLAWKAAGSHPRYVSRETQSQEFVM